MTIKTSYEIWSEVPTEDRYNIAHTKEWVAVDELKETIKEILNPKLPSINKKGYDCEKYLEHYENNLLKLYSDLEKKEVKE